VCPCPKRVVQTPVGQRPGIERIAGRQCIIDLVLFRRRPASSTATSSPMQGLHTQTPSQSTLKCSSSPRRSRCAIGAVQREQHAVGCFCSSCRFFLDVAVPAAADETGSTEGLGVASPVESFGETTRAARLEPLPLTGGGLGGRAMTCEGVGSAGATG
jgi:hypothetical protein